MLYLDNIIDFTRTYEFTNTFNIHNREFRSLIHQESLFPLQIKFHSNLI